MELSASLIKTYKTCRRKYELRYLEELEPVAKAQALTDGTNYHAGIEAFYKDGEIICDMNEPKISAMVWAYAHYIAEQNPELAEVETAEKWFEYPLTKKHSIVGRNDAIAKNGMAVEHKTTSNDVDDEYVYNLQWDEQILTYMLATGINEMLYTVIKKPTIRQKQNETAEEFYERCKEWYSTDTDLKMRVIKVTRSHEEIEEHRKNLIVLADEIENQKHFYRNPTACTCYNRRCEYAPICLNYNPQLTYVEFEKKKRYSEELEENGIF